MVNNNDEARRALVERRRISSFVCPAVRFVMFCFRDVRNSMAKIRSIATYLRINAVVPATNESTVKEK